MICSAAARFGDIAGANGFGRFGRQEENYESNALCPALSSGSCFGRHNGLRPKFRGRRGVLYLLLK
jgi:hypothetical protein